MKQLVILSGKGGTGKTSVTAAFAHLVAEAENRIPAILADADVDGDNAIGTPEAVYVLQKLGAVR